MNNIHSYPDNGDLPDSGGLTHVENYSGSTSSAYDEVSPHMHNSTPCSNESAYEKNNQSTISSKKSKLSHISSEDNTNLTIEALEKTLTEDKTSKIKEIIGLITNLSDTEKMLLQLQFPISDSENIPYESINVDLNANFDLIGSCSQNEHSEALTWVMSHLEENKSTCLQKQEVYEDYKSYCMSHNIKCLSTADFGKVMKKVFPNIKARRLGARGQSRYCYSGLRNRQEIQSPMLSDVTACLESNENANDYRKRDNNTNSEVESYSSQSVQNDLSNIPEYELGPNILVDAALVIIDFIKKVGVNKEVMSLKQAVRYLLRNNQVETRSPHALRLLSIFEQMEGHKSYTSKKYSVDQIFNTIKKEETLSSPCSATPQRSSTASPQNLKRQDVFASPIPNKTLAYCDMPKQPLANFNYNQHYYNNTMSSNQNVLPIPHNNSLSNLRNEFSSSNHSLNSQKLFLPTNCSTPVKNPPMLPQLSSPLLDKNPSTTKKLELSNNSKLQLQNYSTLPDNPLLKPDFYDIIPSQTYHPRRQPISSNSNTDCRHLDVSSPATMTPRYVSEPKMEYEDFDKTTLSTKLLGEPYTDMNFNTSPRHDSYSSYSNFTSTQSPMNAKPFLNTPGNSPSQNEPELADYSTRGDTSMTSSQMSLKNENCSSFKHSLKTLNYQNNDWLQMNLEGRLAYGDANAHHFPGYHHHHHSHHRASNDEFIVTSTTKNAHIDHDGHPSTTMLINANYK